MANNDRYRKNRGVDPNYTESEYQRSSSSMSGARSGGRESAERRRRRKRRQRMQKILSIVIIVVLIAVIVGVIIGICSCVGKHKSDGGAVVETTSSEETTTASGSKVTMIAVGDVIAHETVLSLAKTDSGYDFTSLFAPLKNDISSVDLAMCNLETVLGGGPYTGYPAFNTPDEMGLALIDAGFNVITEASNHSMDAGTDGIQHAVDFWKEYQSEVLMVGLHGSQEEADAIPTVTINGITIAILNYTYGLNDYELPAENSYMVTLLNDENRDYIVGQIQQAASQADFVIVAPHWGTENEVGTPNSFETSWAQTFADAGADLIIGTHPHVIQDIDWITASDGSKCLCYYSLGNFVSNQQYTDTVLGGMAYLDIVKDDTGTHIDESTASVIPVVTHNDKTANVGDDLSNTVIQTYYLADYTDDLAAVHDTRLSYESDFSVAVLNEKAQATFGDWIRDRIRE